MEDLDLLRMAATVTLQCGLGWGSLQPRISEEDLLNRINATALTDREVLIYKATIAAVCKRSRASIQENRVNELLKVLERTGLEVLPEDFKPKISRQTVLEQLAILRRLKSGSKLSLDLSKQQENSARTNSLSQSSSVVSGSSKRKQQVVGENQHGSNSQEYKVHQKMSRRDDDISRALMSTKNKSTEKLDANKQQDTSTASKSLSSVEHCKKMQSAQNLREAMEYFQEVKKRSQGSILQKINAASPYNFFLTSVTDSKQTHTEPLSLQMFDILDPSLGDLESSLQLNFMVEFGWLMAQYHISKQGGKPITLLYKEVDAYVEGVVKHVTAVKVECPTRFGSHHTKMCVMAYTDGSVRVCVHTANLVESDWNNRVQGVWLSPACPVLGHDADSDAGESATHFKRDIIKYLSAYRLSQLQPWIGKLRRADFSCINVFFVASVPGSHKGIDANQWGHTKLGALLAQHAQIPAKEGSSPSNWQLIAQCSSIGSLGPQPTSWFCGEIKQAMTVVASPKGLYAPPPIRLVYPTFNNVSGSYDGLLGGGCLPYCQATHNKQSWLQQYLFQWKCDLRHRTQAMPHIKTYCRVSPDLSQLAWFHLTSANLSKAAWGSQTKAGANNILSYEAGVLFLPKFLVGQSTFPLKKGVAGSVPVFPMPYDLPLTQYSSGDIPWFIDVLS